ncbi:LysR family transcriptional regulator [Photobacterium sp. SDRW27]|uniref:LysR family transcriptional regulator n=1 Tax=Photobacterium obscurum TaxID=2829490 RepID=UPI0022447178|nr:LysR family transcriptional regulator [Photobacterium obscurum]MCW8331040.1 LysR family transcriptional regulator [Photobacterium obscurum]
MKIENLEAFVKIAQLRSFTQAADACFCTQATISLRLKNLEMYFKTQLFDRVGRNIELTEEGRRILPFCQSALSSLEQSKIELEAMNGLTTGSLALCSSNTPGTYLLPRIIAEYHKQYSGIDIDSRIRYARDVIQEMLFDGEAELGFVSQPEGIDDKKITCQPVLTDELCVIVSSEHESLSRWLQQGGLTMRELQKQTLLLSNQKTSLIANLERASAGKVKFNTQIVLGSMEAVKKAVCLNTGIAIVSQFLIQDEVKEKKLFQLRIKGVNLQRTVYLLHRRNRSLSPAAQAFIRVLETELLTQYPERCLVE